MAIVRGATVFFVAKFRDENDALTTVDTATLYIQYPSSTSGDTEDDEVTLTYLGANLYGGEWESEDAFPGRVRWSVRGELTGVRKYAEDGSFKIEANAANPDPE
jgi:hypothetical protein